MSLVSSVSRIRPLQHPAELLGPAGQPELGLGHRAGAAAERDPAVRVVVLTGTGRAFCVGQDLREHIGLLQRQDESLWQTVPQHYNPVVELIATMNKPVIAALNGVAAGAGAAFAFAADLRVLADIAGFNLAFAGIADPRKFYASLREIGAEIVATRDFPDHHVFTEAEAQALAAEAGHEGLQLVTTRKDWVRLSALGGAAQSLVEDIAVLDVELAFEAAETAGRIIEGAVEAFRRALPK